MKNIQFYIKRRGELLSTLQRLVVYCHMSEAWQDDHHEALSAAEKALEDAGVDWEGEIRENFK